MNTRRQILAQCGALVMVPFLLSGCRRRSENADRLVPRGREAPADLRKVLEQPIPTETSARIRMALKVAETLKRLKGGTDFAMNTCAGALEQPQFTGTLGREGAVVLFDDRDEPISAVTTREIDYETGTHFQARSYTEIELRESADQMKSYFVTLQSRYPAIRSVTGRSRCIPIFSQSFQLAVCDALLNLDKDVEYALRPNLLTKSAQLVRVSPSGPRVVASEAIYYSK